MKRALIGDIAVTRADEIQARRHAVITKERLSAAEGELFKALYAETKVCRQDNGEGVGIEDVPCGLFMRWFVRVAEDDATRLPDGLEWAHETFHFRVSLD